MARPSKLTPEAKASIVEAILHGCTYKDSAEAAGISYDTFNEWMKAGEEAKKGAFFEFSEAVKAANAQCAVNFTRVIQTAAAKGDARYALEWLKRRRRSEWGDNVDVTSGGDKLQSPVVIIEVIKSTEAEASDE